MAICGPAAVLFLRIVVSFAAERAPRLRVVDGPLLFLFFAVQLAAAWYLRRLLPERKSPVVSGLQVTGVFLLGLLFSVTGAVMLEAFGYSLFYRLGRR